jgi:hypothetical protein
MILANRSSTKKHIDAGLQRGEKILKRGDAHVHKAESFSKWYFSWV